MASRSVPGLIACRNSGATTPPRFDSLGYRDLGISIECSKDGALNGFTIIIANENTGYQPYCGIVSWKGRTLNMAELTKDDLPGVFGDWYWMDADDEEVVAFYEHPGHEMQIEMGRSGAINELVLTREPLLADAEQRGFYKVNKPWPPEFGR